MLTVYNYWIIIHRQRYAPVFAMLFMPQNVFQMAEHRCNTCNTARQLLRLGHMLDSGSPGCNYPTIIKLANMRAWVYVDVFLVGGLLLGWQTFRDSLGRKLWPHFLHSLHVNVWYQVYSENCLFVTVCSAYATVQSHTNIGQSVRALSTQLPSYVACRTDNFAKHRL